MLVVEIVTLLVGVDEGKIEAPPRRATRRASRQPAPFAGWCARRRPRRASSVAPFASTQQVSLPSAGQRQRQRESTVAGERADLERAARTHQAHQQAHELYLISGRFAS